MSKAKLIERLDYLIQSYTECLAMAQESRRLVEAWPEGIVPVEPPVKPPSSREVVGFLETWGKYGVEVQSYNPARYKLVAVRHLSPAENKGRHHVYVDVFDEGGQRVAGVHALAQHDGVIRSFPLDKRPGEPMGNTPIYPGERLSVYIDGSKSDIVYNIHTGHPDELGPNGETWNSWGHHSFYLRFEMVA